MQNNTHILIVDDVVDNIKVAMNILKEEHKDLSFAMCGEEALGLIEKTPAKFDLILLDIMMPRMGGFEFCRKVKEIPHAKDIPIIFLTAKVDVDAISQGFSLGAVDYISKPFFAEELLARVRTHIQLGRSKKLLKEHNLSLETKIQQQHRKVLTELEDSQKEIIWVMTELMESISEETGKHIRRVAEISSLLAHFHPSLGENDAETLFHAAPMHDIGKITVPHDILHKPGRFTDEEFEIMKVHTSNAHELLRSSERKLIKAAAVIAHEHHEKWNGQGYPRQLKETDIHIYGRIVALADVFDALSHKRCYKEAWDKEEVLGYIKQQRGVQFDPELVDIMLQHSDEFQKIVQIT